MPCTLILCYLQKSFQNPGWYGRLGHLHPLTEYQVVSKCNLIGLQFNQRSFTLPSTCGAFWRRCYRPSQSILCLNTCCWNRWKWEEEEKKKCSHDTHVTSLIVHLLNATRNAARPPRGKCASIVKRSHEPPALSALTITALITPSSKGDTKGRKRAQKRDKDKYKESGIAASRLIMSVIGRAQLF